MEKGIPVIMGGVFNSFVFLGTAVVVHIFIVKIRNLNNNYQKYNLKKSKKRNE